MGALHLMSMSQARLCTRLESIDRHRSSKKSNAYLTIVGGPSRKQEVPCATDQAITQTRGSLQPKQPPVLILRISTLTNLPTDLVSYFTIRGTQVGHIA